MKILLLTFLLLLLLCSIQVLTLTCYTCKDKHDTECKEETPCNATANFCQTIVVAGDIMSRTCEETCEGNYFTTCCSEDLCWE